MEIHFKPELEDKLNQIAAQAGREAGQMVEELVETYTEHSGGRRRIIGNPEHLATDGTDGTDWTKSLI